jgi:hypothetical protein
MKFYFDESGNFQMPAKAGEHRVGIVSGVVIPESDEAEVFKHFDSFVASLPGTAFEKGEPKGRLLRDAETRAFAQMMLDIPGKILLCPTMLDLTTLFGHPESEIVKNIVAKFRQWEAGCIHDSLRKDVGELADETAKLRTQQALRLAAWAQCIKRSIQDSLIAHHAAEYLPAWHAVRFEIDAVEQFPIRREETVFRVLLPALVSNWSRLEPFALIEGIHTDEHPFVQNWDRPEGIDVGKLFRKNVHYACSATSKGIQMADMAATIIRRAVIGLANSGNLRNYGFMMTRTIGNPFHACGLFSLALGDHRDLERRYAGIADAINGGRASLPRSYSTA